METDVEAAQGKLDAAAIATRILSAHDAGDRFVPFAASEGIRDIAAAYELQAEYVRLRCARNGTRVAGYKIGLTSRAMQVMCGIDTPVAGMMLADAIHSSGTTIDASKFGRVGLEFEIAVRISKDIPPCNRQIMRTDLENAIDGVCPAIEIVDDRNCDYSTLEALSLVADNAWNAGIVLGEFSAAWPPLEDVEGRVAVDGDLVATGFGRDVLGHPFVPLAWLANHLAAGGGCLRAGDIVTTGSIIPTQFPVRATEYLYSVGAFGTVACRVVF